MDTGNRPFFALTAGAIGSGVPEQDQDRGVGALTADQWAAYIGGGGGGGGGTTNYNMLSNKPKLNNRELSGNTTLAQVGAASATDVQTVTQDVTRLKTTTDSLSTRMGQAESDIADSHTEASSALTAATGAVSTANLAYEKASGFDDRITNLNEKVTMARNTANSAFEKADNAEQIALRVDTVADELEAAVEDFPTESLSRQDILDMWA